MLIILGIEYVVFAHIVLMSMSSDFGWSHFVTISVYSINTSDVIWRQKGVKARNLKPHFFVQIVFNCLKNLNRYLSFAIFLLAIQGPIKFCLKRLLSINFRKPLVLSPQQRPFRRIFKRREDGETLRRIKSNKCWLHKYMYTAAPSAPTKSN